MDEIIKVATRKDFREKYTESEAREILMLVRKKNTEREIELELRKIYDSSLEDLSLEEESGLLLFGETMTSW